MFRARDDRVLAGVCGGLAKYLKIEPVIVRVIAVVLFILSPVVVLVLYVIGALLIPLEGERRAALSKIQPSTITPLIIGLALVVLALTLGNPFLYSPLMPFSPLSIVARLLASLVSIALLIIGFILLINFLRRI